MQPEWECPQAIKDDLTLYFLKKSISLGRR
jgi:hypothetical protein